MAEKKRRKRKEYTQESLFRTHQEAGQLIRAADDLMNLKANVCKYKAGNYGVKVKDACITDKLPEEESQIVCDAINTALQNAAATLCYKAQQINSTLILRISHISKPDTSPTRKDTGKCFSCVNPDCPHPKIKEKTPEKGCPQWTNLYQTQPSDSGGVPQ